MNGLRIVLIMVPVLMTGCSGGGDTTYSLLPDSERFQQQTSAFNNKLDILFVVNDQPSMSSFQQELAQSMSSFMSLFQTKGFNFKIAVATSSAYTADPTLSGYNAANVAEADFNDYDGTVHSGEFILTPSTANLFGAFTINAQPDKNTAGQDGRAFSSMRMALQNSRPINAGFLRSDSFLAVIIVDNQDDFSGNGRCTGCQMNQRYNAPTLDPVSVYKDFLNSVTGTSGALARYNVSAMTQSAAPCQGGTNMTRIMELANETNGVVGDICQADFGASMAQMADRIAVLSSRFFLTSVPVVSSIIVIVDGVTVANNGTNGWQYDASANAIVFYGDAIPEQDAVIDVHFDPVTVNF